MAERSRVQNGLAIISATSIGALMAWAGSDGSIHLGAMPLFAVCAITAFAINWLAFVPSAIFETERYYDLVGGITYLTVTAIAVTFANNLDLRTLLVAGMTAVWSLRLSTFLFQRISKAGSDDRFDDIKGRPLNFLAAWTLQALWAVLTAAAALAVITSTSREPLGAIGLLGVVIWLAGMAIEVIADRQKSTFKEQPENDGKFIDVGLWAWSRHPNYFGEIVLWTGVAIIAAPALVGWQLATLISPVFVTVLLTRISGIPMLEDKADKRWEGQDDYEAYKRRTPVLIPVPPSLQK